MHIVFVDSVPWPYRIDAPLNRPIGGTQSALCYLMIALAGRGLRVTLINAAPPHEYRSVRAISSSFPPAAIADAEAVIMINDPVPGSLAQLTPLAPRAKKILWQHHAPDQPSVQMMAEAETLRAWDAVIFVSAWQEQEYVKTFPAVAAARHKVLRNAISPAFENLFGGLPVLACKSPAPRLAYTSTPFRGLDRLLLAWPQVLAAYPGAELQIFSSMKLYQSDDPEPIARLLDHARQSPGVTHVGPVPQSELAEAMRESLILAYPNSFPETACIAVMEALAAGCIVVTSDMAALPETLGGYGEFVPYQPDLQAHANDFARRLIEVMAQANTDWKSGMLEKRLAAQVAWAHETYSWAARAGEWEAWLRELCA